MYESRCEYCEGTVQPRTVKREAFKHRDGFVILEDVTIGVCDSCGNRYYCADILHAVHAVATGAKPPETTKQIPVSHLDAVEPYPQFGSARGLVKMSDDFDEPLADFEGYTP